MAVSGGFSIMIYNFPVGYATKLTLFSFMRSVRPFVVGMVWCIDYQCVTNFELV